MHSLLTLHMCTSCFILTLFDFDMILGGSEHHWVIWAGAHGPCGLFLINQWNIHAIFNQLQSVTFCVFTEGKAAANTYDSKYIEVSAAIDHKIDELLVGVLKQIRLIKKKYHNCKPGWKFGRDPGTFLDSCCLLQARENVLAKIFRGEKGASKSCDNLYVL